MFKAWLFGVAILFVLAEFSIWLQQFMLPLPIYIFAGALLAIASNYDSGLITLFRQQEPSLSPMVAQTATLEQPPALISEIAKVKQLQQNPPEDSES